MALRARDSRTEFGVRVETPTPALPGIQRKTPPRGRGFPSCSDLSIFGVGVKTPTWGTASWMSEGGVFTPTPNIHQIFKYPVFPGGWLTSCRPWHGAAAALPLLHAALDGVVVTGAADHGGVLPGGTHVWVEVSYSCGAGMGTGQYCGMRFSPASESIGDSRAKAIIRGSVVQSHAGIQIDL